MTYHPTRPLTAEELAAMAGGQGIHAALIPGSFRPVANRDNDYLIDRAAQKAGRTYSGVMGIANQDASLQESMGPLQDRSRENLASTDKAIVAARRRLRAALDGLRDGAAPPGLDPQCHRVRSATFVVPADAPFATAREEAFIARAGVPHTSI